MATLFHRRPARPCRIPVKAAGTISLQRADDALPAFACARCGIS